MAAYRFIGQGFNVTGESGPRAPRSYLCHFQFVPFARSSFGCWACVRSKGRRARKCARRNDQPSRLAGSLWFCPSVIGRLLNLDEIDYTLIGVLPSDFDLASWADLWVPIGQMDPDELSGRVFHPFGVIARLKTGVSILQAQARLSALANQAALAFPATNRKFGVVVHRLEDSSAAKIRRALLLLFAAVGLVLLVACANIVNLFLSRNSDREKEMALRTALGADQLRLVRQLLTESLLLCFIGGVMGLAFALAGLRILESLLPSDLANLKDIGLNGRVLGFAITVCVLSGIICGLAPVLQSLKTDLNQALKWGSSRSRPFGSHRLQSFLVAAEISLALMPLIGAGLLLKSFHRLIKVDPGFRSDHLLTMQVTQAGVPTNKLREMSTEELQRLSRKQSSQFEQIAERIKSLPGVDQRGRN